MSRLLDDQPEGADLAIYGFSDEQFHVRGGNQQIPVAVAEHLGPDAVRLGRRMESIVRRPQGDYEMLFRRASGDETVIADIVLLTLPFAVLRDLDYGEAGFDDRKHRAIQELGRGRQSKQHLQFDRRVWNEKVPRVRTDAMDFLVRAEPVFPGLTAAWNGRSTQGIPHLDPNFGCSYSYWRVGQYQCAGSN